MKQKYFLKTIIFLLLAIPVAKINGQIISQYVDTDSGTSPKGIEIWNNTSSILDFSTSNLVIEKGVNGAVPDADATITEGTLAPGAVMVIGSSNIETYLTAQGLTSVTYVLKPFTFNGDDALVVKYGGVITDIFGTAEVDPGSAWFGSGVSTADQNIRLIDETDGVGTGIATGDVDGFTDPSTRFVTVSNTPSAAGGLEGFGIAPITTIWDGSDNADWNTVGNWSNGVPVAASNISIPNVTTAPVINGTTGAIANDLTITETEGVTIIGGGSLIVSGSASGEITYKRNLPTANWYLIASPVVGETIENYRTNNSLATGAGTNVGLAPYLNDGSIWNYETTTSTGILLSGIGYSTKCSSAGDLIFTGTMPTTDIAIGITAGAANKFNLLGNPYPSYIPANTAAEGTTNILTTNSAELSEETIWFWDQSIDQYVTFNQASPARFIAPGQGFFVSANVGGGTFMFSETMQSHQTTDVFSRAATNRFEINLSISDGINSKATDVYYINETTTGFDNGYDSSIFSGTDTNFAVYTHAVNNTEERNLAIQSLPDSAYESMVIPVGIHATSETEITFSAIVQNLPNGIHVFLEDRDLNTFTRLDEAQTNYKITITNAVNGIGRFYLHTTSQRLSTKEEVLKNVRMYKTSNTTIRITGLQYEKASVKLVDTQGKEVVQQSFKAEGIKDLLIPKISTGIYIVQLQTKNGTLSKKIIIE